jgi:hypothetical protein
MQVMFGAVQLIQRVYSLEQLQEKFGPEEGIWIYDVSRGKCVSPVVERRAKSSIQSMKNFRNKINSDAEVFSWIYCFCHEVYDRAQEIYKKTKRWPKTVMVTVWGESKLSRSGPFLRQDQTKSPDSVYEVVKKLLGEDRVSPCFRIAVALGQLAEVPRGIYSWFPTLEKGTSAHHNIALDLQIIEHDQNDVDTINNLQLSKGDLMSNDSFARPKHDAKLNLLDVVDADGNPNYYRCLECGEILSRIQRQEHEDHHLAVSLSRDKFGPIVKDHNYPNIEKTPSGSDNNIKRVYVKENFDLLQVQDEKGNYLYFRCIECREIVAMDLKQEHIDYHFAVSLARDISEKKKPTGKLKSIRRLKQR